MSSIGTHTLIGRAISLFLTMGTKCFRNNAKIQPMRRNFFLQLGTLEMHWELYWEPLCECNFGDINRIFLHSLSSNASCGGCLSIYGGDRNQLCAMNLGAPCGHRRHTLDVKKTDTNTDKFLSLFSFFLSLYMHHQSYEWQFFFSPTKGFPWVSDLSSAHNICQFFSRTNEKQAGWSPKDLANFSFLGSCFSLSAFWCG